MTHKNRASESKARLAEVITERDAPSRAWEKSRLVVPVLMAVALLYAVFAGLHTVFDLDMGWHLATGRYVLQHHTVPSTDVLSYTSAGTAWIYPPFAGVLLYLIFSFSGYAGLSWFCALSLIVMVALLLDRPSQPDAGMAAALAILAVPDLALRATPRADLFSLLFFTLFAVRLWRYHRGATSGPDISGGNRPALRLWILPVVMLLWVNLHPGFIAGLGMIVAYLLIEGLELVFPVRRGAAGQRLRQAWPSLLASVLVTFLNPYGWKIYQAAMQLSGINSANPASAGPTVMELSGVPLSLAGFAQALDWRNPGSSYWWLTGISIAVVVIAAWRHRLGAALVMAVAIGASIEHLRYKSFFSILAVVLGSSILVEGYSVAQRAMVKRAPAGFRKLHLVPALAALLLCLMVCVRIADLASDRYSLVSASESRFGTGESWAFPERAATFIQREHLPGNIFELYNLGGFAAWRLGPDYRDFIDGRLVSPLVWNEQQQLQTAALDSQLWQAEAERRNINVLFFSLSLLRPRRPKSRRSLCQPKVAAGLHGRGFNHTSAQRSAEPGVD